MFIQEIIIFDSNFFVVKIKKYNDLSLKTIIDEIIVTYIQISQFQKKKKAAMILKSYFNSIKKSFTQIYFIDEKMNLKFFSFFLIQNKKKIIFLDIDKYVLEHIF